MTLEIKAGQPSKNLSSQPGETICSIEYCFTASSGSRVERVVCRDTAAMLNVKRGIERHFTRPVNITRLRLREARPTNPEPRLQERLREAESLLSEVLRLAKHLEKKGQTFLTLGHENRIRKFLCLLPSEPVEVRELELTAGPFKGAHNTP